MAVRFRTNRAEVKKFLKGPEVQADLASRRARVEAAAGEGFGGRVNVGTRARGTVIALTNDAKRRQAREHVLERAVWAGR